MKAVVGPIVECQETSAGTLRQATAGAEGCFICMTPDMFDEVLQCLTPRMTKKTTNWRAPLDPGLKVVITLRHFAAGSSYKDMQYGWRVLHNSISILVREVCQSIVDEYQDELLSPPATEEEWKRISDAWYQK